MTGSKPPVVPGPAQGVTPYRQGASMFNIGKQARAEFGPGYALLSGHAGDTLVIPANTTLYTCHGQDAVFDPSKGAFYGSNPVVALYGSKRVRSAGTMRTAVMYAVTFDTAKTVGRVHMKNGAGGNVDDMRLHGQHIAPFHHDGYTYSVSDPSAVEVAIYLPRAQSRCSFAPAADENMYAWMASAGAMPHQHYFYDAYTGGCNVGNVWPLIARNLQRNSLYSRCIDGRSVCAARCADTADDQLRDAASILPHLACREYYDSTALELLPLFAPFVDTARTVVPEPAAAVPEPAVPVNDENPWPPPAGASKRDIGVTIKRRARSGLPMDTLTEGDVTEYVSVMWQRNELDLCRAPADVWETIYRAYTNNPDADMITPVEWGETVEDLVESGRADRARTLLRFLERNLNDDDYRAAAGRAGDAKAPFIDLCAHGPGSC